VKLLPEILFTHKNFRKVLHVEPEADTVYCAYSFVLYTLQLWAWEEQSETVLHKKKTNFKLSKSFVCSLSLWYSEFVFQGWLERHIKSLYGFLTNSHWHIWADHRFLCWTQTWNTEQRRNISHWGKWERGSIDCSFV